MKTHHDTPLICSEADAPDLESLICASAHTLPATATGEMMYMPGGLHTITPVGGAAKDGDATLPITIFVDATAATELNKQHAAILARGKKPMFDFNHEDRAASFWPESYFWKDGPQPGIYCRGEWTAGGEAGVNGKEWRQFSPVFHVSKKRGTSAKNPAQIVCREWAAPNMGGLVNDPAFHSISPLWAKNAAGAQQNPDSGNQTQTNMTSLELTALENRIKGLENDLVALKAKDQNDAETASAIKAKQNEIELAQSKLENESLKAKNLEQETAIKARNKADAEIVVAAAVARGAIAAKDTALITDLTTRATNDPSFSSVIKAMQGNPALGGRMTTPGVSITKEAPSATLKEYTAIIARNAGVRLSPETAREKGRLANQAAALFARDIENNAELSDITIDEAIRAADVSDTNVGLLAGTLVLQRALPLLQYEYPILGSITSDYSDAPGTYGQTETSRILVKPAVQTYDASLDTGGRPKGWTTASPAQSVDVSVTLDEHVGIPIVFGQNTLSKTVRNLFAEQAPMTLYALGGYAVNKLTALLTAANFNAYRGTTLAAGATTDGSATVTVTSTLNAFPGQAISGTGIPSNTYISSVTNSTTLVLTRDATATGTGLTLTLSDSKVPTVYSTYAKALADFDVASLGDIKTAFDINEVPQQQRFALLSSAYHTRLANAPVLNSFFAAMQKPDIITRGLLPEIQGFSPQNAPYFPTSSNRVGFAGHKASLIFKTRLPVDFTDAVGAMVPGSVTTVTVPGGISVLLVQYVNLQGNYAEWRPEVLLGAAVGDRRAGLVLTSQ